MEKLIYGLLGRKLGHSYSVPIHKAFGCGNYRLIELEPEALEGFLTGGGIGGLNVTIPYKRAVMPFCRLSPEAEAIGSVNTIVPGPDGALIGHNTDACGFRRLAENAGIDFAGRRVAVLGSGGASLTVQAVAAQMGAADIKAISRSGEHNYENPGSWRDAEIIVNATPVGMYPEPGRSPVELKDFPSCRGVLDLVYNPLRTALVLQARAMGIPAAGGLGMLVWQARAAEELFTGRTIDDSAARAVLETLRRDVENIVLIGMPGCGKSTVGAELARLCGREALDIDAEIEKKDGMAVAEIFRTRGEAWFRRREREELALAGAMSGKLILTGGGAVLDERNLPSLRQNGRVYLLHRPAGLLERAGRPLSMNADLEEMYARRRPMYEKFRDADVENTGSPADAAREIWREFCEHTCDKRPQP